MKKVNETISNVLADSGERVETKKITQSAFEQLLADDATIADKGTFHERPIGNLAYEGLAHRVREVCKRQNGKTTTSAALHGQLEIFEGLKVRASVPLADGQLVMVELSAMDRDEWLSAANFKIKKGRETIAEGERMLAVYAKYREIWDKRPGWSFSSLTKLC